MRQKFLLLIMSAGLFGLISCSPGQHLPFVPGVELLKEGVVNKYYYSYFPDEGIDKYGEIEYRAYTMPEKNIVIQDIYDPGFRHKSRQIFRMDESSFHLTEESVFLDRLWQFDTLRSEILLDEYFSTRIDSPICQTIQHYSSGQIRYTNTLQHGVKDTIVDGKKALLIDRDFHLKIEIPGNDTSLYKFPSNQLYVKGLGLFYLEGKRPEGVAQLQLIEQLSMDEFAKLRAEKPERVAYIDPDSTLDFPSDFNTCFEQEFVNDYYNGEPDAAYEGGKQALLQDLMKQINTESFGNESGYLTFRFVVNCEGRAGWFTTEQADLDYLPKQFPPALINHLFVVLQSLDNWHPTVIRGKERDAYCYLTFKFNHGQLIDLLP